MEYITRKQIGDQYGFKRSMAQVITERSDFPKRIKKVDRSYVYRMDEVKAFFAKHPPNTFTTRQRKEYDRPHTDTINPILKLTQRFYRCLSI